MKKRKIIDIQHFKEYDAKQIIEKVKPYLEKGYEPQGGILTTESYSGSEFWGTLDSYPLACWTLIKYEE